MYYYYTCRGSAQRRGKKASKGKKFAEIFSLSVSVAHPYTQASKKECIREPRCVVFH